MFKKNYTRWFAHFVIVMTGCLSAVSVWAVVQPPPDFLGLPWVQIAVAGIIALWGGIGRTAVRAIEDAQERRDKPVVPTAFNLKAEITKDVIVSSGLGFLIYLLGVQQQWDAWLIAPALWVSGYMGKNLITSISDAVQVYISQIGNKGNKP